MTAWFIIFAISWVAYADWLVAQHEYRRRVSKRLMRIAVECDHYVFVRLHSEPWRWVDKPRARA